MKTEFEINKRLAELLGLKWFLSPFNKMNETGGWIFSDGFSFDECDVDNIELPDYCNSWADMGDVIFNLKISIAFNWEIEDTYSAFGSSFEERSLGKFETRHTHSDKNPLKAAALVAIKILESRL